MKKGNNSTSVSKEWKKIKIAVEQSLIKFLENAPLDDLIRQKSLSKNGVFANLCNWMENPFLDKISPNARLGILEAIKDGNRWGDIAEAFYTDIEFGTGGIRGRATIRDEELLMLKNVGIQAQFLRGPNTINDLVFARISAAIAKFARDRKYKSLVIGYDSRLRGKEFAHLIAGVFIAYGIKVYLFDDVVPYPEVTFAIPFLKADMGILVSASHNDRRYNGYKLSSANGSQFSIEDRSIILNDYIGKIGFEKVKFTPLNKASNKKLVFLGGSIRYPHLEYYSYKGDPIDLHTEHFKHVLGFLLNRNEIRNQADNIHLAYSAYNGAGGPTVKRLVDSLGISSMDVIAALNKVDGMFPAFEDLKSPKGYTIYQQPDPGEERAADTAFTKYIGEYGKERAFKVDALIGTDPDADRTGITIPVPDKYKEVFKGRDFKLLDADTAWSLIIWYRLNNWKKIEGLNKLKLSLKNCFLVQSHTTTDIMPLLAEKFGLGWVKTWVGFAQLAAGTEKVWNKSLKDNYFTKNKKSLDFKSIFSSKGISGNSIYNFAALEQSNGFSILGARPKNKFELGLYGHVRDKDGTFAAMLFMDVIAHAKQVGKTIWELIDENLYLDSKIGLIRTGYRAAPQYGQYEGLEGRSIKMNILRESLKLIDTVPSGLKIGNRTVTRTETYKTGKYDIQHGHTSATGFDSKNRETFWFPDEGIRFYFEDDFNHLTIRPSGTSQSLRFHIQLREQDVNKENLQMKRISLDSEIESMFETIGEMVGVDWNV
jgi:phosphomannomutase